MAADGLRCSRTDSNRSKRGWSSKERYNTCRGDLTLTAMAWEYPADPSSRYIEQRLLDGRRQRTCARQPEFPAYEKAINPAQNLCADMGWQAQRGELIIDYRKIAPLATAAGRPRSNAGLAGLPRHSGSLTGVPSTCSGHASID